MLGIHRGRGTLSKLSDSVVWDGTVTYAALSLRLRRFLKKVGRANVELSEDIKRDRLALTKAVRRDTTATGEWIVIGDVIVYFKKIKGKVEKGV